MEEKKANSSRREFFKTGAGIVAASALESTPLRLRSEDQPPSRRPNLVFFLGEGLRHDEMSALGNPILRTPHFDRLVHQGVTFENSFAVNALCLPSRATILTGLYSHVTGAIDNRNRPIPPQFPIFPDLLRQAGYEMAFVGKSHVRGALRDHYWDYYFGFNGQANYYHPVITEGVVGQYGDPVHYDAYVDDLLTDRAVKWVSGQHRRPFCLFLWFYAPHPPFYRPRNLLDLYNGVAVPKPSTFDADIEGYPGKSWPMKEAHNKIGTSMVGNDDPRTLEEVVKDHYAGVVDNDRNVGRILEALDAAGVLDDTAVLLSSDHGFFLGEWRMYDKRFMYEPSIRVPLTIRYPRLARMGARVPEMALNLDLAPTILELAGASVPSGTQGRSLVPFLRGEKPAGWRKDWYYEYYEYPEYEHVAPQRGIRTDRYKLIWYYFPRDREAFELYDLENDPQEIHNLYGDPHYKALGAQLLERIKELRRETGDTGNYDVTQAYVEAAPGPASARRK